MANPTSGAALQQKFAGKCLSDYWRLDRSSDKTAELASILDGARNACSIMEGKFQVVWSGQSPTQRRVIRLDPAILNGFTPPFPGRVVDVVIGLALHEVGHEKWTKAISDTAELKKLSGRRLRLLHNIHNILEDAYVDNGMSHEYPVLGAYISSMRRALTSSSLVSRTSVLLSQEPDQLNVMQLWSGIALYDVPIGTNGNGDMLRLISGLMSTTMDYIKRKSTKKREEMVWSVFHTIDALPSPLEISSVEEAIREMLGSAGGGIDESDSDEPEDAELLEDTDEGDGGDESEEEESEKDGSKADDSGGGFVITGRPKRNEDDNPWLDEDGGAPDSDAPASTTLDAPEDEDGDDSEDDKDDDGGDDGDLSRGGKPKQKGLTDDASEDEVADQLRKNISGEKKGDTEDDGGNSEFLPSITEHLDEREVGYVTHEEAYELDSGEAATRREMREQLEKEAGIYLSYGRTGAILKQAKYNPEAHHEVLMRNQNEVLRMRKAFVALDNIDSRWRFGTIDGKLDTRRIVKASFGRESIYKRRDVKGHASTAIELVMDTSGSMAGKYGIVADAACIFVEALNMTDMWYEAMNYSGAGSRTSELSNSSSWWGSGSSGIEGFTLLASRSQKLSLDSVYLGGMTPTGEAIAIAAMRLRDRHEVRKVIIHFTDGGPDNNSNVLKALDYCGKLGITVLNISIAYAQANLYGEERCMVINDVNQLASGVERMLKQIY